MMQRILEPSQKSDSLKHLEISDSLNSLYTQSTKDKFCLVVLLINFLIFYLRPQDVAPIIGSIKIPYIFNFVSIAILLINLQRNWTKQNIMILIFLSLESIRFVVGKYAYDPFVTNDFNQYQSIKSIALETFGLSIPLTIFLANSRGMDLFLKVFNFTGLLLAIYVITHHGQGPGGYLGDENDVGLVILFFMTYPLTSIVNKNPFRKRSSFLYFLTFIYLVAIVATASRGAVVGLVAIIFICFLLSKSKLKLILIATLLISILIPFLSREYINDMKSITKTQEGTAKIRRHYWKLATRVFLDPRNTLYGVGMNNLTYHLSDYEDADDLEKFPSAAGRAVHSIYFEVLGDLGLWGVFLLIFFPLTSIKDNLKNYKISSRLIDELEIVYSELEKSDLKDQRLTEKQEFIEQCFKDLNSIRPIILTGTLMFATIFSAGAFISIFYYPILWTAIGFNSAIHLYASRLNKTAEAVLEI